ncbi:MAG: hypothetical protein Q4A34_00725 [Candidatus Saccharibacteria bacterium]|nr:hypothetical protein [Candidatus Saccharibacteria bacterium]
MTNDAPTPDIQQAIIARELIDIYRTAPNKAEVAESLGVVCFAMARLCANMSAVDWDTLAAVFDGLVRAGDSSGVSELERSYQKIIAMIQQSR